ncbi:unnamed protein product [Rhodiola kirilowii]
MLEEVRELPELPHDVIVDILSRLPCKCLVKFRCVSKQWNSLIRSHNFTKLKLSRSIGDTSRQRVLLRLKPFYSVNYDDLDDFCGCRRKVIHEEDTPPPLANVNTFYNDYLVGECNGLICIMLKYSYGRIFLLWNPTIREFKVVRKNDVANVVDAGCMFDFDSDFDFAFDIETAHKYKQVYGFGYDSSSDEYKILRLMVVGSDQCEKVVNVEIYRVGSRIWRKIEHPVSSMTCIFPSSFCFNICAFLNGSCHWVMSKFPTKDNVILRFDLGKEEVEEVTLPPYLSSSEFLRGVMVFGGKLVLHIMVNNVEMEIWVMNEYGAGSFFTKKVTVHAAPWCKLMVYTLPICFSKNGGVLMYDDHNGCLFMHDPEKKTWQVARGSWRRRQLMLYAESLISPFHIPNAELSLVEIA